MAAKGPPASARPRCNTPAVMELLGEGGVTEKNLMQYLGIIEQRTNEILQVRGAWGQGGQAALGPRSLGVGARAGASGQHMQAEGTWADASTGPAEQHRAHLLLCGQLPCRAGHPVLGPALATNCVRSAARRSTLRCRRRMRTRPRSAPPRCSPARPPRPPPWSLLLSRPPRWRRLRPRAAAAPAARRRCWRAELELRVRAGGGWWCLPGEGRVMGGLRAAGHMRMPFLAV